MLMNIRKIISMIPRGGIALMAIAFVCTLLAGFACMHFSEGALAPVTLAAIGGTLSVAAVRSLYRIVMMDIPVSYDWGTLGTIIGVLIILASA